MDMLSLCRKRYNNTLSSAPKRPSARIPVAESQNKSTCRSFENPRADGYSVGTSSSEDPTHSNSLPAISEGKQDGSVILRVLAKPGARQSALTDIGADCVGIQIGAPARSGQANYELVDYLASILKLKKYNISVDKGLRSRIKSVNIVKPGLTPDKVRQLLDQEITKSAGVDN